jgi:hypothetical protein
MDFFGCGRTLESGDGDWRVLGHVKYHEVAGIFLPESGGQQLELFVILAASTYAVGGSVRY